MTKKHSAVSRNSLFSKYQLTKLKTWVEINPKILKIWTLLSWPAECKNRPETPPRPRSFGKTNFATLVSVKVKTVG